MVEEPLGEVGSGAGKAFGAQAEEVLERCKRSLVSGLPGSSSES